MRATGTAILIILMAIYSTSSEIHAGPSTSVENNASESHLGKAHLEADGRFHIALDASISYGPIRGLFANAAGKWLCLLFAHFKW